MSDARQSRTVIASRVISKLKASNVKMKSAAKAMEAGQKHKFALECADAIVNVIEACDLVDKNVMRMVFERLKQIDRMEANP